jgi:long-chain acyl-CoA synthetase
MERIWLKSYPPGVPPDINAQQFPSLVALAEDALTRHADRRAYVLMDHAITYREVDRLSATFAAWLQRHGFRKGDRIALMLPNVLQYPVAMLGALRAGMVVVNTNPLYTADELRHQLNDSGATAIVVLENFCHVVERVRNETSLKQVIVTGVGDMLPRLKGAVVNFVLRHVRKQVPAWNIAGTCRFRDVMRECADCTPTPAQLSQSDLAFLQ